jgi:hypothetical protein
VFLNSAQWSTRSKTRVTGFDKKNSQRVTIEFLTGSTRRAIGFLTTLISYKHDSILTPDQLSAGWTHAGQTGFQNYAFKYSMKKKKKRAEKKWVETVE